MNKLTRGLAVSTFVILLSACGTPAEDAVREAELDLGSCTTSFGMQLGTTVYCLGLGPLR